MSHKCIQIVPTEPTRRKSISSDDSKSIEEPRRNIPKALKEQVWIKYNGEVYKKKCFISWCSNIISVFSFECGHNLPFSKGGSTTIDNLRPICSNCNKSMSNNYTIDEWMRFKRSEKKIKWCCWL